jgi:hypothetical protein
MPKSKKPARSNDEIRRIMLQYFYERNRKATSVRGKRGSAATHQHHQGGIESAARAECPGGHE